MQGRFTGANARLSLRANLAHHTHEQVSSSSSRATLAHEPPPVAGGPSRHDANVEGGMGGGGGGWEAVARRATIDYVCYCELITRVAQFVARDMALGGGGGGGGEGERERERLRKRGEGAWWKKRREDESLFERAERR